MRFREYVHAIVRGVLIGSAICFCLVTFVSCHYTNPELRPYEVEFYSIVQETCPELKVNYPGYTLISFSSLKEPVIGECSSGVGSFMVLIDRDFWKEANSTDKYSLVMHEFTHCFLGLDHVDDSLNYMFPRMAPLRKVEIRNQVIANVRNLCPTKK